MALLLLCLVSVALVGSADARELAAMRVVRPDAQGVTRVNLSVVARRVRIPLATRHTHDKQRYFEYTGRFYVLDDDGNNSSSNSSSNGSSNMSSKSGRSDDHDTAMLPGPCIHVAPGGKLVLQLTNTLGDERDASSAHAHNMYTFHSPNTTNLHFHGMHSDPNIDDPFVTVAPGARHVYALRIPRSHVPGFHWYHAHYHGSVYYQVMSGLFGAMLVDDGTIMSSPVHPFRAWPRHVLLMHLYRLGKSSVCDGATLHEVDAAMATYAPAHPRLVSDNDNDDDHALPPDLFLVNGQHQPTVTVTQFAPTVLHVGYAAGSCYANVSLPRQCAFHVAAYDGVPLQRTQAVSQHWLYFTTATRIDVVVQCDTVGVFALRLRMDDARARRGDKNSHTKSSNNHNNDDVIFYLAVRKAHGRAARRVHFPLTLPRYTADYLDLSGTQIAWRDISLSQADVAAHTPRPYYVLGQGSNCSSLRNSSTCSYSHFLGPARGNASAVNGFAVPLYTVLTAHLYGDPNDTVPHPFHFHVNHFKFIAFEPRVGGQHANHTMAMYGIYPGQFRDTIPVLDGVTTVQWQVASYTGEVVYHCHNLVHEDHGMMLSYVVYASTDSTPSATLASRDDAHAAATVTMTTTTAAAASSSPQRRPRATPPPSSPPPRDDDLPSPWQRRARAYYLVLAIVFFVASAVALAWQWVRRHPHHLETVALTRTTIAGQAVALTDEEAAPLLSPPPQP